MAVSIGEDSVHRREAESSALEAVIGDATLTPTGLYLLHLLACAVNGAEPRPIAEAGGDAVGGGTVEAGAVAASEVAPTGNASEGAAGATADALTWQAVYELAARNSVEGCTWAAARHLASDMPTQLAERWEQAAQATLWRRLQFDAERDRVIAAMDAAGLAHLPLKGITMAERYPDPTMRSMADNDILYGYVEALTVGEGPAATLPVGEGPTEALPARKGLAAALPAGEGNAPASVSGPTAVPEAPASVSGPTAAPEASAHIPAAPAIGYRIVPGSVKRATREMSRIMGGLGYRDQKLGHGNADCFYKKPCFNFEMHRILVQLSYSFASCLDDPWVHAVPDDPSASHPLAFHFDMTFEYIFHVVHAYKHFSEGGCGVRNAVDEYVFLHEDGDKVDRGLVASELVLMDVDGFERVLNKAALEAFGPEACPSVGQGRSAESARFLATMLGAGTYGSTANRIKNRIHRSQSAGDSAGQARLRYLIDRITQRDVLADYHPVVARHRWLMPLFLLGRLGKAVIRAPKVLAELRAVRRFKD